MGCSMELGRLQVGDYMSIEKTIRRWKAKEAEDQRGERRGPEQEDRRGESIRERKFE